MWIKLHTKLLDWEWASCPETIALWIHILLRANYETKRWQGVEIPRGSLVTSLSKLALETGLSVSQIRTNLERLKATRCVTSQTTSRYTIISVCNYDSYQLNEEFSDKVNDTLRDKQIAITSEYKPLKKESISKEILKKEKSQDVVGELANEAEKITCGGWRKMDLSFVDEELKEVFSEFLDMRTKIRKPLKTAKGVKARYEKLMKLSGGDMELAKKIANQSIGLEWQDFYELKDDDDRKGKGRKKQEEYSNENYWNQ